MSADQGLHNKSYQGHSEFKHGPHIIFLSALLATASTSCSESKKTGPVPPAALVHPQDRLYKTQEPPPADAAVACTAAVELTWLGVTNYVARYEFDGKRRNLFLDHQINGHEYEALLHTLEISGPDLVVIGHDHFDHTGECFSEGDWLCQLAKAAGMGPETDWKSTPISQLPNGKTAPLLLAPSSICNRANDTPCTATRAVDGVQRYRYPKLGLTITVIPSAHSVIFGSPSKERPATGASGEDAYTYLIEFPAETEACRPTLLWANSLFQLPPSIDFKQVLSSPTGPLELNYRDLLEKALTSLGTKRVDLWTVYAYDLVEPQLLTPWLTTVRPHAWTNHHHGAGSAGYFPELARPFDGDPLGGAAGEPQSPWLPGATLPGSAFLPLEQYWDTFEIRAGRVNLNPDLSTTLRERFRVKFSTC